MRETATDAFLGDLAGGATFNDVSGERGEGLSKARSRRGVRIINLSDPWLHVDKGKFCGRTVFRISMERWADGLKTLQMVQGGNFSNEQGTWEAPR